MFETISSQNIAGFRLDGEKIRINPAQMTKSADSYSMRLGGLLVILNFEPVVPDFYRWTVTLRNEGNEKTAQITEFCGMDLEFPVSGEAVWESIRGDTCNGNSFMPVKQELTDGCELVCEAAEGRSSQGACFPYFDVTSGCGSAVFAIGWTGQWKYTLSRTGDTAHLMAGFTDFDLYLEPGESVRSVGAIVYSGKDLLKTRQDFRRIFREKLSPAAKHGGHMEVPLSLQVFDRYFWNNPAWATEEGQLHCIDCAGKCGYFNTYWLDAAWFRDGFPHGVGNYEFEKGFPNGLAPVSRAAKEHGFKFMLWFEPERNYEGSDNVTYRRDQLLHNGDPENKNFLYDLTDEASFAWLRDTLIRMIRDNGIDIYRQDFNMNPLSYWRHTDPEGKRGWTENRYITGLYRLWDALLAEFPGLVIDNCASGGRRLDFEMNMRSLPMWRSDTGCFPSSEERPTYLWHQNQTLGLSRYLPYHTTASWTTEANTFRSASTMGLACNFDVMNDAFDADDAMKPLDEISALRDCWDGDFYPLTEATLDTDCWCAYQLALESRGFCAFFRRRDCEESRMTFTLHAVDPEKTYEVTLSDNGYNKSVSVLTGAALASFTAEIPGKNESLILSYRML